ncbi:hypothetical protein Hanom_Chr15g01341861 [Helianthus anomalus]
MVINVKPQGLRFKKFEIWTKMAKMPKQQQRPKWEFTLCFKLIGIFMFILFSQTNRCGYAFKTLIKDPYITSFRVYSVGVEI